MNVAVRKPGMTRDRFLDWPGHQDGRYEFDGFQPVAMTGGSVGTGQIAQNLYAAVRSGLGDGPCRILGPDAGITTVGNAIRYPDALVTCTRFRDTDRLVAGAVIVFEIVNRTSGRIDRIVKVREYQAVPSIRRYVIIEHRFVGATVLARPDGSADWTATTLAAGDVLHLPEVGVEFPIDQLYAGTNVGTAEAGEQGGRAPEFRTG